MELDEIKKVRGNASVDIELDGKKLYDTTVGTAKTLAGIPNEGVKINYISWMEVFIKNGLVQETEEGSGLYKRTEGLKIQVTPFESPMVPCCADIDL